IWGGSSVGDDGKGGPCANNPCGQEFVVLFSDGRGDYGNPKCTAAGVAPCQAANLCTTPAMQGGSSPIVREQDGDNFLDPAITGGAGPLVTNAGVRQNNCPAPGATSTMDFLDHVVAWSIH